MVKKFAKGISKFKTLKMSVMNEICIIGYGALGKKVFETLSLSQKERIKIYNRTKVKLKNVKKDKKYDNIEELFRKSKIIFFLVKDANAIKF